MHTVHFAVNFKRLMAARLTEPFLSLRHSVRYVYASSLHSSNDKNVNVKRRYFGVKCIFAVGGLGFVDSVNRYFVYKTILCCQVEVVVPQYFNLAEHLSGSRTRIMPFFSF